jgi:hypothetical protein
MMENIRPQRLQQLLEAEAYHKWQPIETAPKDGTVTLRPHRLWGVMDVRYKPTKTMSGAIMNWLNGDYTAAWIDESFLPFWMPLPDPPST